VRHFRVNSNDPETSTNEGLDFERCSALHNAIVKHAWQAEGYDPADLPSTTWWQRSDYAPGLDELQKHFPESLIEFLKRALSPAAEGLADSSRYHFFYLAQGLAKSWVDHYQHEVGPVACGLYLDILHSRTLSCPYEDAARVVLPYELDGSTSARRLDGKPAVGKGTADLPANGGSNAQDPNTKTIAHIVNNLAEDTRFCDRPYVQDGPKARFYAGVPITSPKGINIGALCVLDDTPRDGLEDDQVEFLRNMAATIMSHLELV
jgi:GAF domain-containing protein